VYAVILEGSFQNGRLRKRYGCCNPYTMKPIEASNTAHALYVDYDGGFDSLQIGLIILIRKYLL
jgi:hypothetical protein